MDPKKMQAFVGGKGKGGGEGKPGKGKDRHEEPEREDESEAVEQGEPSMAKFDDLIPLLEEHAADIEDAASMVEADSGDVLAHIGSPSMESVEQAMEGLDGLDDELKEAIAKHLPDAADGDHELLAKHLTDEGMVEDGDAVAAWFSLVKKGLDDMAAGKGEETEEEPEEAVDEGEVTEDDMGQD